MKFRTTIRSMFSVGCLAVAATAGAPAYAQVSDTGSGEITEIIVTARKREETALQVPVSVTALSADQLQNFAVNNVDSMARAVPSLIIGEGGGTVQGGIVSIRGLAGADNNPLNDQAVSFNIDGVAIGRATIRRMGDFDTAQVEVLKGPQALFFGKNSPAGIIVMKSADPTSSFEAKVSSGYESEAREWRSDAYISGPITDSLGFRIAGFYSDMDGWAKNISGSQVDPSRPFIVGQASRAPDHEDWATRGTLKFDNGGAFNAKLKLSYGKVKGQSSSANTQFVDCPLGRPQVEVGLDPATNFVDNCKADDVNEVGGYNVAALQALFPHKRDWDKGLFMDQYQFLGGLEMNLDVTDSLTLTSQSGYYKQNLNNIGNFTQAYYNDGTLYSLTSQGSVIPGGAVRRWDLISYNDLALEELSQELRLTSSLEGPVNFMIGGLITDTTGDNGSATAAGTFRTAGPAPINNYWYQVEGESQSIFAQVIVNPIEQIEVTAGGRYSWEQKKLTKAETFNPTVLPPSQRQDVGTVYGLPNIDRKVSFDDFSPEATIAYKPNPDLNIYVGYKEGFLSGGFAAVVPNPATFRDNVHIYEPQQTEGFEGGIKAALLDRDLRVNLAYYNYKTTGLQVGLTVGGVNPVLLNAASARTKGVEFDVTYDTPVEGLSLTGAMNYNRGRYLDFTAPCYGGQPSEECFSQVNTVSGVTGFFQNLDDEQLVRAPEWTGNVGFNYEGSVGGSLKVGFSGNMSYSDSYFTDVANTPGGKQDSYELYDASLRVGDDDDVWQVALIGRNLGDKYYFVRSSASPFSGTGNTGALAANSPLRVVQDTAAYISRGRELWVRLSYKFGAQ